MKEMSARLPHIEVFFSPFIISKNIVGRKYVNIPFLIKHSATGFSTC